MKNNRVVTKAAGNTPLPIPNREVKCVDTDGTAIVVGE